jgi:NADH-quinone oxidoreductase subunit C/D
MIPKPESPKTKTLREGLSAVASPSLRVEDSPDMPVVVSDASSSFKVAETLKRSLGYRWFVDRCGVDYLGRGRSKRFEVVTHLYAPETNERVRIKIPVDESEEVPTLVPLWKAADWFERETWDMYGIRFRNHPNLTRILTHVDFKGHPLRKDYDPEAYQESDRTEPIHFDPIPGPRDEEVDPLRVRQWINIGPSHPATHGTLRIMAEVDGEVIMRSKMEIGYLHRCFEKMCETHTWNQCIPYTDRLNYCSAPHNNIGFCMTIEKMLGIHIPERAQAIRMILSEFSRIIDHFVCVGTNAVDVGALTTFWYMFAPRERVYDLFEKLCGARLTVSLTRVGGQAQELPSGWIEEALSVVQYIEKQVKLVDRLLTKNPIWISRCRGICGLTREQCADYGVTGPVLRASGVNFDLRKVSPYYFYDQVDFDIPIAVNGDVYDRYLVRMEEIRQSCRILRQLLRHLPSGGIKVKNKRVSLPDKEDVYNSIEGLMNHFMLVINDVQVPEGDGYLATESPNGELGFYCVSSGSGRPWRVHCRAPSFVHFQPFPEMIQNRFLADAIAALGSVNIIAGELDR